MKRKIFDLFKIIVTICTITITTGIAQNNSVQWSVFDMGFGTYNTSNTKMFSAVGQIFIGNSRRENNVIKSGFLIDSLFVNIVTGIDEDNGITLPTSYALSQNYPNPFNPSTTIKYSIPKVSFVTLKVYDILGREVATLVNEEKTTGNYQVNFDASGVSTGVYLYKIQAGSYIQTKKMILLR